MPRKPLVGKSKLLTTPPSTPERDEASRVAVAPEGEPGSPVGAEGATPKSSNGTAAAPRQKKEKLRLTTPKRRPPKVTNFRLGEPDLANLRELVRAVQELSPYRQVSATSIVKALLHLGRSVPPEDILHALKETL
jgi:hypothetical protein